MARHKKKRPLTVFDDLIPELRDWNDGRGIDVESWIGHVGDYRKAIAYSAIFWPQFVEIEGCVVMEGSTREVVLQWLEYCGGDRRAAEATMNHLHLLDLHGAGCPDATAPRLVYLGRTLKESYEYKLQRDFPAKRFCVEFDDAPVDPADLTGYVLTFYQIGHVPQR